jgi:hypothetical protein
MKLRSVLTAAVLAFTSLLATTVETADADPRSVLLIYGEARLMPGIVAIDRAIRRTFEAASSEPIRFYTEYIDLSWLAGDRNRHDLLRLLGRKYAASHLDLILVCGDGAARLVLRQRALLFRDVPVVFCRPVSTALGTLPPDVTGVSMPPPWAATLELVLRLHPGVERVVLVGGAGDSDRGFEAHAREAFSPY